MTKISRVLLVAAPLVVIASGCGSHVTPTSQGHTHHHKHNAGSHTNTPSASPSAAPSSSPPSTSSTSPVQTQSTPNSPVLTSAPPAGGVAGSNQVKATVDSVQSDGTVQVNGETDNVYLIHTTLRNPTTAMILFQLNDIIVAPKGSHASASLNDYSMKGITQQNSLFPYPIVPQHPNAVVVRVPSGQSVSGDFTVEVPQASAYGVSLANTTGYIATFSA